MNNLHFLKAGARTFLKTATTSSQDRARFYLSYFSGNLGCSKSSISSHTSDLSKAPYATSNNLLSFFTCFSFLLNRTDFRLIMALSSVSTLIYATNFKVFSKRDSLIED